jgi:phosphate transport system substrate-binding protein
MNVTLDDLTARTQYIAVNLFPSQYEKYKIPADIVFRYEDSEEKDKYFYRDLRRQYPEASKIDIAKEAFVFFCDKRNPINGLNLEQLRDIYAGRINNWQEVGGFDEPIWPYQRPDQSNRISASQAFMIREVMAGQKMRASATENLNNVWTGSSSLVNLEYRHDRKALGYAFRLTLRTYAPAGEVKKIKLLSVNGVSPTEDNIRRGSYPLSRTIVAIIPQKRPISPEGEAVLAWLTSLEGQKYIGDIGYVSLQDVAER